MARKRRAGRTRQPGREAEIAAERMSQPVSASNRSLIRARLQREADVDELSVAASLEAARLRYEAGKELLLSGDPLGALRAFEEVASGPLRPYIEQELDLHIATCVEHLAEAGRTAEAFVSADPVRVARILVRAAVRLFRAGDFARSASAFEAVYVEPASPGVGNGELAFDAVVARVAAGDTAVPRWALEHADDVADALRVVGPGDWDLVAAHRARTSLAAQPGSGTAPSPDADLAEAIELFRAGAVQDALRRFETMRSQSPSDELAYDVAACLALLGRHQEALTAASEAGALADAALAMLVGDDIVVPGGLFASQW